VTDPDRQPLDAVLSSDHRAIAAELDRLDTEPADDTDVERVVADLVRHLVAEEEYLYPAVAAHISGGEQAARDGFTLDRSLELLLRKLEHEGADYRAVLVEVHAAFSDHVTRQDPLIAELRATLDPDALAELGDQALGAEQVAPSHPRRFASESPRLNKLSGIAEGFVDRVRDAYRKPH
jgi:hypothetical protein